MSLSNFSAFALTRSEMKSVVGAGCGASCYSNGGSEPISDYGSVSKAKAYKFATDCAKAGGKGYWCCKSC